MATERNTPPDPEKSSFERPPKKSLTVWVLLLPLALLIGVLWQSWRQPEQPVQPVIDNGVTPKPRVKPTVASSAPKGPKGRIAKGAENDFGKITIFVPDDNAMLQRQVVTASPGSDTSQFGTAYDLAADSALVTLFERAPDLFPKGSYIYPVRREGNIVKVNMKKSWYEMPQWNQGSSYAMLAQDAIVNTLAAADSKNPGAIKVQFLQDGKPATILGELDVSEPLSPNPELVAER